MKKILFLIIVGLFSCADSGRQEQPNPSLTVPLGVNTIPIEGCEYIMYDIEAWCGHQYTHHKYYSRGMTHKGNCKNH